MPSQAEDRWIGARCGSGRVLAADILTKLREGLHNGLRHHFHPGVDVIDNAFDDFGVELCNNRSFPRVRR